jgi:hypothetical protein
MVVGRFADGPVLGPVLGLCMAPPPEFPVGLAAGAGAACLAGAGAEAAFLSPAALAMLATPRNVEIINAVEPVLMAWRKLGMLIESSFPFQSLGLAPRTGCASPTQRYSLFHW